MLTYYHIPVLRHLRPYRLRRLRPLLEQVAIWTALLVAFVSSAERAAKRKGVHIVKRHKSPSSHIRCSIKYKGSFHSVKACQRMT